MSIALILIDIQNDYLKMENVNYFNQKKLLKMLKKYYCFLEKTIYQLFIYSIYQQIKQLLFFFLILMVQK